MQIDGTSGEMWWFALTTRKQLIVLSLAVLTLISACSSSASKPPTSKETAKPGATVSPTAASSASSEASKVAPPDPVRWTSCGGGFQCGSVAVPQNYAVTTSTAPGPSLNLPVARRQASGPGARSGVLVVDFGGPAISGAETLRVAAALLPKTLLERFDVVSFDPRGTGKTGLRCEAGSAAGTMTARLVSAAVGSEPTAPAGQALPVSAVYRQLYDRCHANDPALLPTITSSVEARDLDRIREALGESKLRYLGISYGTVLGLAYAQRFPDRVAAMVLDGPVDPTQPIADLAQQQASAAEQALERAFKGKLTAAVGSRFDELAERLTKAPLPAPGGSDTTPVSLGDLQLATLTYLQMPTLTPDYAPALSSALAGDGAGLRKLAASQYQDVDGTPVLGPYWATICGDTAERPSPQTANTTARTLATSYPRLGATAFAFAGGACTIWPAATEPVKLPTTRVPISVVGSTGDPVTPFAVAQRLVGELPGSVLITRVGEGHTSFANASGDTCLQTAESEFLLDPSGAQSSQRCVDPTQN